jgi:NAD(P)-dependent dehydrogenase (short-subunit alcohol dehydrogenase family)
MPLNPRITDWQGRVAWLVGASSGIGLATARELHRLGATVVLSARSEGPLRAFCAAHPGARFLVADVTDPDSLRRAGQRLAADLGRLDLAMYCAGHYRPMRAADFDLEDALRHVEVNQAGALRFLDVVLPVLRAQGHGHLSLVASVAGYRGLPNALAYGPTKAALIHMAETLWMDLSDEGVGVSVINPGFVETPLTAQNRFRMPALLTPEQAAEAIVQGWARGRFEIHFPRRFSAALKVLGLLGHRPYFGLVRRVTGL